MNELHKDDRKIREMLVDGPVECEVRAIVTRLRRVRKHKEHKVEVQND